MAAQLKDEHHLLALKVTLPVWEEEPILELLLEDHSDQPFEVRDWRVRIRAEDCSELNSAATLPEALKDLVPEIGDAIRRPRNVPLWIHLARPYGYCGAVDWERLFGPLGRPVLRLPDFLERSREDPEALDIAFCSDATGPSACIAAGLVGRMIGAALSVPRTHVRVHVFAPAAVLSRLARRAGPQVQFHERSALVDSGTEPAPPGQPPCWLAWITSVMGDTALDAVHFVGAADENLGRSALLMSDPPSSEGAPSCVKRVDRRELSDFLARTGAWAVGFTASSDEGDLVMRHFTDSVGQIRPGPALMISAREARGGRLASAYRFLFSPKPSDPPRLTDGMLYCQPILVRPAAGDRKFLADLSFRNLKHFRIFVPSTLETPPTPTWVSAAQRYVEQAALRQGRQDQFLERVQLSWEESLPIRQANTALDQTLIELQHILDAHKAKLEDPS